MQVVSIVGPDGAGPATLAESLVGALADQGAVATVRRDDQGPIDDGAPTDHGPATETHAVGPDGTWTSFAAGRDVEAILAGLAARVDYAVLAGFSDADVPTVALGDADHAGRELLAAPDASAVDVAALVEAVEAADPLESLSSLVAAVEALPEAEYAGAVATFTGRVRTREDETDASTEYLEFQRYDGVAQSKMAAIREDLEGREGVLAVRLHHRTGVVPAGEHVVHVVVLAGHRREAFAAVEDGIDRLKAEVPLFKKEVTVDEEFWAHQRE